MIVNLIVIKEVLPATFKYALLNKQYYVAPRFHALVIYSFVKSKTAN